MLSRTYRVIREDDTGIAEAVVLPIEPKPGDVLQLEIAKRNLEGRFKVRRREIHAGAVGRVSVIVEDADRPRRAGL